MTSILKKTTVTLQNFSAITVVDRNVENNTMNRVIAIFLLHVMILVAIQPIVSMHYCEGTLRSFNLLNNQDVMACCDTPIKEISNDSCCAIHDTESSSNNHICDESLNGDCCDFQTIQVSTDDFQSDNTKIGYDKSTQSLENIWIALVSHFKQEASYSNSSPLPDAFPADGLFLKDISFLTYICIYRI